MIMMIGISLIINVIDCKILFVFEFRKFINIIDNVDVIVIGINEFIDKWNKLINCVVNMIDNVVMLVGK